MTYEQIEKQLVEIERIFDTNLRFHNPLAYESLKNLFKQSFLKYLQREVERLEKGKHKIYDNWATTHDRDDERFTKLTKEEKSYNQAISDQITHLQAQIKELEV